MAPVLAPWHTMWTNDARIMDKHIVSYASQDPSTLGNSAAKIQCKLVKEQGKYNYHDTTDLMYLVLDMRMLDCWRLRLMTVAQNCAVNVSSCSDVFDVIQALVDASKLPTVKEFEQYALELHDLYTTERAIYCAVHGKEDSRIPHTTLSQDSHSQLPVIGDSVLARSKDFMWEAIRSRKLVWSIAEGDVGWAWEQLKIVMFSMSGSSHKKYTYYLLVLVIDLHLQSTPEYREAILSSMVASLSGLLGTHRPVDLLQEWLQRTLESIVQHKGQEFGASFIRNHVSRNLRELSILKEELLGADAESRILLEEYRITNLHSYHPGRQSNDSDDMIQTHFAIGVQNFDSFLTKHLTRMACMRDTHSNATSNAADLSETIGSSSTTETSLDAAVELGFGDEGEADDEIPLYFQTVHDGEITTDTVDIEADALSLIARLAGEDDEDLVNEVGESNNTDKVVDMCGMDGFETDDDQCWESEDPL
ncbi:hypothetical protein F5880DRAFT_1617393 [Lentinula raphanica]|nr:hypothetical protein F5880DRAFT_1617393 [Lentinula raphanica]